MNWFLGEGGRLRRPTLLFDGLCGGRPSATAFHLDPDSCVGVESLRRESQSAVHPALLIEYRLMKLTAEPFHFSRRMKLVAHQRVVPAQATVPRFVPPGVHAGGGVQSAARIFLVLVEPNAGQIQRSSRLGVRSSHSPNAKPMLEAKRDPRVQLQAPHKAQVGWSFLRSYRGSDEANRKSGRIEISCCVEP